MTATCRHCGAAVDLNTAARTGGYCDGCQPALPGIDVEAQDRAAQQLTGEELSAQLRTPGKDVSGIAGKIERDAPLFRGTGENPSLF